MSSLVLEKKLDEPELVSVKDCIRYKLDIHTVHVYMYMFCSFIWTELHVHVHVYLYMYMYRYTCTCIFASLQK